MGKAQGELRGQSRDAEEQYAGGDAAVQGATTEQARRTIAFKSYRDRLAELEAHERWHTYGDGRPPLLVGYTSAVDSSVRLPATVANSLSTRRRDALGY